MANRASFAVETIISTVDRISAPLRRITSGAIRHARTIAGAFGRVTMGIGKGVMGALGTAGKVGGLLFGGLGAGVALINNGTANANRMAKAMGLNVDLAEAFVSALGGTEYGLDNIIDLVEELNNKMGESKKTGLTEALKGGLKTLGLKYSDVKNLGINEQFKKLFDAALKQKDRQAGASGLDQILSGDANKIFSVLADRAKSTKELTDAYARANFQTDESRKGAIAFAAQLGSLLSLFQSIGQYASGILGAKLQAMIGDFGALVERKKNDIRGAIESAVAYVLDKAPKIFEEVKNFFGYLWDHRTDIMSAIVGLTETIIKIGKLFGRDTPMTPDMQADKDAERWWEEERRRRRQEEGVSYHVSPQQRAAAERSYSESVQKTQVELINRTDAIAVAKGKAEGFSMRRTGAFA